VEYQELEAVTDIRAALDPQTPIIHAALATTLRLTQSRRGPVDQALPMPKEVEAYFVFGRHTGVIAGAAGGRGGAGTPRNRGLHLIRHAGATYGTELAALAFVFRSSSARGLQGCRRLLRIKVILRR